jgi:hypothetical protein
MPASKVFANLRLSFLMKRFFTLVCYIHQQPRPS